MDTPASLEAPPLATLSRTLDAADALALLDIVHELSLAHSLEAVVEVVRSQARRLIGADGVTFVLKDGDFCRYIDEDAIGPLWKGRRFPLSACVSGWAMSHRQLVAIGDIFTDPRVPVEAYRPTFVRSMAMAPVRRRDPLAAIGAYWASRHAPSARATALLQALADAAAIALSNAELIRELEAAREQLAVMLENLPELAWSASPDGHIDYYNRRWYEYTGTTPAQMEGWGWQSVHDPAVLPEVLARWRQSLSTGEPFEMEFPLRGADGVFRWFLTRVRPLKNADGRIVRWIGTNTNIDEQRRQRAELKEAIEVRDTFLSVASHELRTPLTSMKLRLQSLAQELGRAEPRALPERVRSYVDVAERQLGRLNHLVGDLLDVSRVATNRLELEVETFDVGEMVRDVASRFELQARRAQSPLELNVEEAIAVRADRLRVDQIVSNLVDNAIKYGAGKPIRLRAENRQGKAVIVVQDEGIGIPPEKLERIFERFARAVSSRHYGGLGLGLFIARTLAQAMGGSITVTSAPGRGSTFTVELPAA